MHFQEERLLYMFFPSNYFMCVPEYDVCVLIKNSLILFSKKRATISKVKAVKESTKETQFCIINDSLQFLLICFG